MKPRPNGLNTINELGPKGRRAQVRRSGEKGPLENEKCSRAAMPVFRWPQESNDSRPFEGGGNNRERSRRGSWLRECDWDPTVSEFVVPNSHRRVRLAPNCRAENTAQSAPPISRVVSATEVQLARARLAGPFWVNVGSRCRRPGCG